MQISPNKAANLVFVVFAAGIFLFITNVTDRLKGLRHQMTELYEMSLDSCIITKVKLNQAYEYASRDDYSVFYTNCSKKSYPILLDLKYFDKHELFKSGSILTKRAMSLDFQIVNDTEASMLRLRDPESMDERPFSTKMILSFLIFTVLLILIAPNSVFVRK